MGMIEKRMDKYAHIWQIQGTYDKFDGKMGSIK